MFVFSLSMEPFYFLKVRILDLTALDPGENDVLIIGTDGLWDVTSNEKAGSIVRTCLEQFSADDPNR